MTHKYITEELEKIKKKEQQELDEQLILRRSSYKHEFKLYLDNFFILL